MLSYHICSDFLRNLEFQHYFDAEIILIYFFPNLRIYFLIRIVIDLSQLRNIRTFLHSNVVAAVKFSSLCQILSGFCLMDCVNGAVVLHNQVIKHILKIFNPLTCIKNADRETLICLLTKRVKYVKFKTGVEPTLSRHKLSPFSQLHYR